jgi:hypothetical protein
MQRGPQFTVHAWRTRWEVPRWHILLHGRIADDCYIWFCHSNPRERYRELLSLSHNSLCSLLYLWLICPKRIRSSPADWACMPLPASNHPLQVAYILNAWNASWACPPLQEIGMLARQSMHNNGSTLTGWIFSVVLSFDYLASIIDKGGSWPRRDSPSMRLAGPRRASFLVWKTLVGQRGCPLFGRNQPHLPRNPQNFSKSEFSVAESADRPIF